jgi:hypothetical protein
LTAETSQINLLRSQATRNRIRAVKNPLMWGKGTRFSIYPLTLTLYPLPFNPYPLPFNPYPLPLSSLKTITSNLGYYS